MARLLARAVRTEDERNGQLSPCLQIRTLRRPAGAGPSFHPSFSYPLFSHADEEQPKTAVPFTMNKWSCRIVES